MGFQVDDDLWKHLMLEPQDYSQNSIHDEMTNELMSRITFEHGGEEFDAQYPLGIPTQVEITTGDG